MNKKTIKYHIAFWLIKLAIIFAFFQWPTRFETSYFWLKVTVADLILLAYFYSIFSLIFKFTFAKGKYIGFALLSMVASFFNGIALVWVWSGFNFSGLQSLLNHLPGVIGSNLIFFSIAFTWRFMVFLLETSTKKKQKLKQQKISELDFLSKYFNVNFISDTVEMLAELATSNLSESKKGIAHLNTILKTTKELKGDQNVDLFNEFEFLKAYISLQQIKLNCTFDIWFSILVRNQLKVYPMILFQVIHSALEYGMINKDSDLSIRLSLKKTKIVLKVRNKINPDKYELHNHSLLGLKDKLYKIFDQKFKLDFELIGDNFETQLEIPGKVA